MQGIFTVRKVLMKGFLEGLKSGRDFFLSIVTQMKLIDVIDILAVAFLLYQVYRFVRDRRAGKLAAGVGLLFLLALLAEVIGLTAVGFLMQNIFQVGLLALVVVFQPELRSGLEKLGGEPLKGLKAINEIKDGTVKDSAVIKELCEAVSDLSASKTGALIVIERTTKLGDVIKTGVVVNADVSSFLLKNIFFNKAPLHDGAVVIRDGRIHAAGCFLPLSTNEEIIKDLGTRHRAGIGMSENSDAVVLIVSEENGLISLALDGRLRRGFNYSTLRRELERILNPENGKNGAGKNGKHTKKKKIAPQNGTMNDK